ncbi:MAG: hypothetical protein KF819_10355 [Labilithrix sp.]|nr:hypothetical protein [Labilithrix sp.]
MRSHLVLRLSRASLARRDVVTRLLARLDARHGGWLALVHAFAFKDDELAFARALAARTHLWIYRVNQRAFGGDFVVVDVSMPDPSRRVAIAVDLKRGRDVRADRAGIQMQHATSALAEIARAGVVGAECAPRYLTGDARLVLGAIDGVIARGRPLTRPRRRWAGLRA